ncbi:Gldg family protein, partial [Salmonella enterica]|uniref:Gldg family protein n=2 Tax=Gammaproteobacteria TaxID=1236 RepID=UPI0022B68A92
MDGNLNGRPQEATPPWQLFKEIRSQFNLMTLGSDTSRIPAHIKTLMVVQPSRLPEQALFAIDQFVLAGGKLMMFVDPLNGQDST